MAKKRHNKDKHHAATAAAQQEAHAVGQNEAALVEETNSDDVVTPGSTETIPDDEHTALPTPPEGDASAAEEEEEEEEQQPLMMPPAPVHPPQFTERPLMMPPAPVHPPQFTERPLNPAIVVPTRVEVPPPIRKRTTPTSSSSSSSTAPSYVPVASLMSSSTSATKSPPNAGKNQLTLTACLIALSSFLWGYAVSVLNVCIVPDAVGSLLVDINLTTEEQETATALVLVGALLSALLSGGLGQRMGLKTVVLLNNVFFLAGGAACALAVTKRAIFLGRFSIGLACGVVTNTVPILLNEISPLGMRGRITSYHQLMLTIGILATGIFGWLIVEDVPSGWRYLNGFIIVPALLQLIMVSWIPESPYWLMKFKGKDQSRRTLMRLRDPHNRDAIEAELSEIALTMETNAVARSAEWSDLWEYKSVLLVGSIMVFFQAYVLWQLLCSLSGSCSDWSN
jgi:MFS family permease